MWETLAEQYNDGNKVPWARILGFFFFSGEVTAAKASTGCCSTGGDVRPMSHSSAAAASGSLASSVSGVSVNAHHCDIQNTIDQQKKY